MMQKDNNNYQWFTYGRSPLDSVREGDRAADYMDKYCTNQNRIMQNTFLQQRKKDKTALSATDLVIELSPNPAEIFVDIKSNVPMDEIVLYDSSFKLLQRFKANKKTIRISMNQLGSGIYYIKLKTNNEIIKYTKLIKL